MPHKDLLAQEYLVQWVAKVAAAEKEYMAALAHMNRPGIGEESDAARKSAPPPSLLAGSLMPPL